MKFTRMGEINLSEMALQPAHEKMDGSFLMFKLSDFDVLQKACLYDEVIKATVIAFVTYQVEMKCIMQDGHRAIMNGQCTAEEFRMLEKLHMEGP